MVLFHNGWNYCSVDTIASAFMQGFTSNEASCNHRSKRPGWDWLCARRERKLESCFEFQNLENETCKSYSTSMQSNGVICFSLGPYYWQCCETIKHDVLCNMKSRLQRLFSWVCVCRRPAKIVLNVSPLLLKPTLLLTCSTLLWNEQSAVHLKSRGHEQWAGAGAPPGGNCLLEDVDCLAQSSSCTTLTLHGFFL